MPVTISQCKCVSEYQDKVYGKNMRVFNLAFSKDSSTCTVCGAKSNKPIPKNAIEEQKGSGKKKKK